MDLHEDIHRAIESYLDPNEFRRWLNSAIQNSRGVTFLLQKRKAKWSDFADWYGSWQEAAKLNPVLGWGVTARNRVVKEEDLMTLSQARITHYGERRKEAEDAFVVPPEYTVDMILDMFSRLSEEKSARRQGTIRVQRRWIDDQLPNYELVAALREMYRGVSEVVERAHEASGVRVCGLAPFSRACVTHTFDSQMFCLPPGSAVPDGLFDLETGRGSRLGFVTVERDEDLADVGRARYGEPPADLSNDPIAHAASRLILSRQFLEADGYSGPTLALFDRQNRRLHHVGFKQGRARDLSIAQAIESEGAWPFTGAVFATESWLYSPGGRGSIVGVPREQLVASNTEFFDGDPVGNREEALLVIALSADGRSRSLLQPFARTRSGIVYGEVLDDDSGLNVPRVFSPVWRNWPRGDKPTWTDDPQDVFVRAFGHQYDI